MSMMSLQKKATDIRRRTLRMIYEARTGHLGGSMSDVEILVALFYGSMKYDANDPKQNVRDRFILSKGHSAESYYTVLSDVGFFPEEELSGYSQYGSRLIGHPNVKVPGVEVCTGALGHGLSCGVGMAIGAKMDDQTSRCFVLMGDGELAEGSVWEAAMAASNYQLDHLVAIIDRNRLQISGKTEDVMKLESLADKWRAFGWNTVEVDGHNIEVLSALFRAVPLAHGKPTAVIANTVKGKGIPFAENNPKWHHGVPSAEEYEMAMATLR